MHELAIGQSLVTAALKEWRKLGQPGSCVVRVRIVAGRLHQLVPDNLLAAFEALTRDTALAGARLEIASRPILAVCRACRWSGEVVGSLFVCGACGATGLDITGGRELYLDALEVESDEDSTS